MDLPEYLVSRQGLFGMVVDFCVSTMMITLLSLISLLTYFDILESFHPFHWLCKATIQDKQYTQEGHNGRTGVWLGTGTKDWPLDQKLWSVTEWVKLLESELCAVTSDQCCTSKYRRIFVKLHRDLRQVSRVLQSLGGQSAGAEGQLETSQNCELSMGAGSYCSSPEGSTEQNNTKTCNMVPAGDRGRIQILSSRLQSLRMYTEERLQLLNSLASCYESYRLLYDQLHHWVMRASRFQEWIHSLACDNEFLIITNLKHQKTIVDEIEQRAPQLSRCQETLRECVQVFKFADLKQQFITMVRLTKCYVIHLRDLLRIRHQTNQFTLSVRDSVGPTAFL
ncbi:uncharacterized protein LOC125467000 isoform X2 [Stegostoma tigrinum]|uniref:uncharacterized protein LOC125467000 isoform X2 n=1 Tax=Stegostoma tigrinum TaxID=3053191 RepID=UPI0028702219|nr:uncharacterized protein LOC125467000 isoform X2 [Stegostoma tigrinum]